MKIGISLLSPMKSIFGFEVRQSMEPVEGMSKLHFQKIVIITLGFIFFYVDFIFDNGRMIPIEEAMSEFEKIEVNENAEN